MKTILVTAYSVNPYKESEDGLGWNSIIQIARFNKVIAVTRNINKTHIERYWNEHQEIEALKENIQFLYFDWPKWILFWKKAILLSMIYYYGWQFTVALWLLTKRLAVDIVHNLNSNNDFTPSFLWLLGKPFIWGPVGHDPKIPRQYLLEHFGWKAVIKDRLLWIIKLLFWNLNPFLLICKRKASHILCTNMQAAKKLHLKDGQFSIVPSVASEMPVIATCEHQEFRVISVGKFIQLKGFDVTIRAFASFYNQLNENEKAKAKLILVGSGPLKKFIHRLIKKENIQHCTELLEWMPRSELVKLYQTASVFLFPSHEGAGMAAAEAMSYGLPVLCWKNSGSGEIIHPSSSLSICYRTYKAGVARFARRLKRLCKDQEFYRYEQQLATERFEHSFTWNVRGTQFNNIYESVIAEDQKQFDFVIHNVI
jgi:glycosyltransferase involved in cell wall biosynthesis